MFNGHRSRLNGTLEFRAYAVIIILLTGTMIGPFGSSFFENYALADKPADPPGQSSTPPGQSSTPPGQENKE